MSLAEPALWPTCLGSSYQIIPNTDLPQFDIQVINNIGSSCDCAGLCANSASGRCDPQYTVLTWFLGSASPLPGNLPGLDMPNQPSTQSTADICLDICAATQGCLYVNYILDTRQCWLKGGSPQSSNRRNIGFGVNYRVCANQVVVPGQDVPGYDLGQIGFTTSCDCAAVCQNTQGCDFYNYGSGTCWLKTTDKSDPNYYTWFINAVSPIQGNLPNLGAPNTVDQLIQGSIQLDSPQSCLNLCLQTKSCLFVNFKITNTQTASVSCDLKRGFVNTGFQRATGFNIAGSGRIPQPVGVTTVVPSAIPSNTAVVVPGGPVDSGSSSTSAVVGTPTLVGGGSGGNTNGGQGSGGNGSNGNGNGNGTSGNVGNGPNGSSSTSSSFPLIPVAGGVGGVVLIAALVVVVLVYRRKSRGGGGSGGAGVGGKDGVDNSVKVAAFVQGPVALRQGLNSDFKSSPTENDNRSLPVWSPEQQNHQIPGNLTKLQQEQQSSHMHHPIPAPLERQFNQYTPPPPGVITMGSTQLVPPARGESSYVYRPRNITGDPDIINTVSNTSYNNGNGNGVGLQTQMGQQEGLKGGFGASAGERDYVRYAYSSSGFIEKVVSPSPALNGSAYPVDSKSMYNDNVKLPPRGTLASGESGVIDDTEDNGDFVPPPSYPGTGWTGGNGR
ncbi:hypothetical protein HDU76_012422 [Blyttiomyces sp. JEL0837]|nr:hypothetical protein HDU76_012422 [Blyttiomyces sp. JEL0837]